MKKILLMVMALLAPFATAHAVGEAAKENWRILPCASFGPIKPQVAHGDLVRLFGAQNVQDVQVEGPEGENYPGSVVFPNDPSKKVRVLWQDATRRVPVEISIEGSKSVWKTEQGVTLGTGLKELEKLNGAPFTLSGFEWDYGGRVVSWNEGLLAKAFPKKLSLRLDPTVQPVPPSVSGERNLKSNLPALQVVNPAVTEIACILQ